MKPKAVDPIRYRIQSNSVLPAEAAAYVAELARDPSKARDFLVRAGIIEDAPCMTCVTTRRAKLALDVT